MNGRTRAMKRASSFLMTACLLLTALLIGGARRNLSTTMGHSTGLIREQCPVW